MWARGNRIKKLIKSAIIKVKFNLEDDDGNFVSFNAETFTFILSWIKIKIMNELSKLKTNFLCVGCLHKPATTSSKGDITKTWRKFSFGNFVHGFRKEPMIASGKAKQVEVWVKSLKLKEKILLKQARN